MKAGHVQTSITVDVDIIATCKALGLKISPICRKAIEKAIQDTLTSKLAEKQALLGRVTDEIEQLKRSMK